MKGKLEFKFFQALHLKDTSFSTGFFFTILSLVREDGSRNTKFVILFTVIVLLIICLIICRPCNCHEGGSSILQCHLNTGICTCKANAEGNKCERCKNGTYNSDPNNPDGCSPCFCFGRSTVCSSAAGFVKTFIKANFSSRINIDPSGILPEIGSPDGGDTYDIKFSSDSSVKLTFLESFKGNQLPSYGQLFKVTMDYADVDSLNATWNATLTSTDRQTAYFNILPQPSLSNNEYHARLHEHYTLNNLTAYDLQSILVDIDSVQIHGSFKANGSVKISAKLESATKGVGQEVGFVENCTCPNNYTELSCGFCNSGKVLKNSFFFSLTVGIIWWFFWTINSCGYKLFL